MNVAAYCKATRPDGLSFRAPRIDYGAAGATWE